MVAVVSGNSLGLSLTSMATLGQRGVMGEAGQGRSGEQAYVNVANGNLVLQDQDDRLVARGLDAVALRTYNSQGLLTDDNGDNWSNGIFFGQIKLVGTLNAADSTIERTAMDGAQATYTFDVPSKTYVSTAGVGAYDSFVYDKPSDQLVWTDGDTRITETYQAGGKWRLQTRADANGNTWQFKYDGKTGLLNEARSGKESTTYTYIGLQLDRVVTQRTDGTTLTRADYLYDTAGRLSRVAVDLTPDDNVASGPQIYVTNYGYDGSSKRIAWVEQTDKTRLDITYVQIGSEFRVSSVTDALGNVTRYDYDIANRRTSVTDPLGQVTVYQYDALGQLKQIAEPAVDGVATTTSFFYKSSGDLEDVIDGEGRTIHMEYDGRGNQLLQRDSAGNTITRRYSLANQLLAETVFTVPDPDGAGTAQPGGAHVTRYVYDASFPTRMLFVISPEGRVMEHRYDGFGLRQTTLQYTGARYDTSVLPAGADLSVATMNTWVGQQVKAAASRTDMAYDARGQLQSLTQWATLNADGTGAPEGVAVTRYTYDQAGLLRSAIEATGAMSSFTYDGLGRMEFATDALNRVAHSVYDDANARTTVTLANGLATLSAHDRAGRLISVTQNGPVSSITRYAYDADNRLLMTEDASGVRHWMLYDEDDRKIADIDGTGSLTEYVYDRSDRLVRTIAYATEVDLTLLVDTGGQPLAPSLASIRPAATGARGTQHIYDAAGRLARTIEANGAVTENIYDGASRVVEVRRYASAGAAEPERVTRNFHDADGLLIATLDEEGTLTELRYDNAGRLMQRLRHATPAAPNLRATGTLSQLRPQAPSGGDALTTLILNGRGQVLGEVDAEGYLTESRYDSYGHITQRIRYAGKARGTVSPTAKIDDLRPGPNGEDRSTSWVYDALHRVTRETDPQGTQTNYTYDIAGNLISTVQAAGLPETRSLLARFDLLGRLTAELTPEGAQRLLQGADIAATWANYGIDHTYDAAGRRTSTTDANNLRTLFFYDADGHLTHTVNAEGEVSQNQYNAFGQLSATIRYGARVDKTALPGLAGGLDTAALRALLTPGTTDSIVHYEYDALGNLSRMTDALLHVTQIDYNAFGEESRRLQDIGDGTKLETATERDRRGMKTRVTVDLTGIAAVTEIEYDAFGRVIRTEDANGVERRQSYDRLGRMITTEDGVDSIRSTAYDAFDRVVSQKDALNFETTHTYESAFRRLTVASGGISVVTVFDALGRTASVTDGRTNTTSYTYDLNGNLKTVTNADGSQVNDYDKGGRLIQTTDAQLRTVSFDYDGANRLHLKRTYPGGSSLLTTFDYDAKGQQILVTDPGGRKTAYEYDLAGRLSAQIADPDGLALSTRYDYDAQGHTLKVTDPQDRVIGYSYDKLGRRERETVDPGGLNLTRRYKYDALGNVTAVTQANGGVTRYTYDGESRVVFTVGPMGAVTENSYDLEGQLVLTKIYRGEIAAGALSLQPSDADVRAALGVNPQVELAVNRVWDRHGRMTATVNSLGEVVKFSYDEAGNVIERRAYAKRVVGWTAGTEPSPAQDPADQRLRAVYDGLNRAIYSVDGAGTLVANTYDKSGNLLERVAFAKAIDPNAPATAAALKAAADSVRDIAHDARSRNVYDGAHRLIYTADGAGAVTQYVHDGSGLVVQRIEYATAAGGDPSSVARSPNDRASCYAYDAAGRQCYTVDALGTVTESALDDSGNVVRQTVYSHRVGAPAEGAQYDLHDLDGMPHTAGDRTQRMAYDNANRLVLSIDAAGSATAMEYNGAGELGQVRRYAGAANTGGLTDASTLTQMRGSVAADNAHDRLQRFTYDAAGRVTDTFDAVGLHTHNDYDAQGRLEGTVESAAGVANRANGFSYDAAGRITDSTDALGFNQHYEYDGVGNRVSFRNEKGDVWTYGYDGTGRVTRETSPQVQLTGMKTVIGAGGIERLQQEATVTAAVVTTLIYDALGQLRYRTEALGRSEERTTEYQYDASGNQVRVIYPEVGVYNLGADSTANGATGVAARMETRRQLVAVTTYNLFGEAVVNQDVAGNYSHKAYDKLGRVLWDVDAAGYVTGYQRTSFGDVERLTRFATPTGMGAQAAVLSADQIHATVYAPGVNHGSDRTLESTYDHAGRVLSVTEAAVYAFDSSATAGQQYFTIGKTTTHRYNALGDLTQVAVLKNPLSATWHYENRYYDIGGRLEATVDAGGFLTTQKYDAHGNLLERTEFARALSGWNGEQPTAAVPAPNVDTANDRTVRSSYDKADRKTSETRVNVEYTNPGSTNATRGDLTTGFEHDAVGNLTVTTDAAGAKTTSHYDALGRVRAVAEPTREGATEGSTVTPLTEFLRDAYGNVVVTLQRGEGAVNEAGQFVPTAADRVTLTAYDLAGRAIASRDANSVEHYASFDAHGHVSKQWQGVTGGDGVTRSLFRVFLYDALGQQTHVVDPTPTGAVPQPVITQTDHNAFGEVTARKVNGEKLEYFEYDNAGRLWNTNTGDGVGRITLYDLQGNATADLRSNGGVDVSLLHTAGQAVQSGGLRRTDQIFDAVGHVVRQILPEREELQGGVTIHRTFLQNQVTASATPTENEFTRLWSGTNSVRLTWNSLASLGSGDIRVDIQYVQMGETIVVGGGGTDESGGGTPVVQDGPTVTRAFLLGAHEGAAGADLQWEDPQMGPFGGILRVRQVTVWKKDITGTYHQVIGQAGSNAVVVAAPADPSTTTQLQVRPAGSGGSWLNAPLVNFGDGLRYDATGAPEGDYEYQVLVTAIGENARTVATGTLKLAPAPLSVIGVPLAFNRQGLAPGAFAWNSPGAGVNQVLRARLATASSWTTYAVTSLGQGYDGVDLSALQSGTYQYELLWSSQGDQFPYAHATGQITVVGAIAPKTIAPIGLPPIAISVSTTQSEGSASQSMLTWSIPVGQTAQLRYRTDGSNGSWSNLPVTSGEGESSAGMVTQLASVEGLAPGNYEYWLTFAAPGSIAPVAQSLGRLTIRASTTGHFETRLVPTTLTVTVTPQNPANFIIGYTAGTATYGPPVVVGTDESGQPILGEHYARSATGAIVAVPYRGTHLETRTITPPNPANFIISSELTYGPPVVVGTDEAGQPILGAHYTRLANGTIVGVPYTVTDTTTRQVPRTVQPPAPSNFITSSTVTYGPPVVVGYDEGGQPILGAHYARNASGAIVAVPYTVNQTVTRTIQVPVQVLVGQDPVYSETTEPVYETRTGTRTVEYQALVRRDPVIAYDEAGNPYHVTDEAGNPLYTDVYETRYREESYTYQVQVGTRIVRTLIGYTPRYETQYVNQTVTETVPTTVYPDAPSLHIIGQAVTYGAPVVVGYDGAGQPILGEHYARAADGTIVAVPYTVFDTVVDTVTRTVVPPDPALYVTGGTITYGPPVVVGTDESGQPILGAHYARNASGAIVAVPYTETSTVPDAHLTTPPDPSNFITGGVPGGPVYGPPVVVGQDESGNPIFGPGYHLGANGQVEAFAYQTTETRMVEQQVWVDPSAEPPTLQDRTPPYTPGRIIPGVPGVFNAFMDAQPNSTAISGGAQRLDLTQVRGQDGDQRAQRPSIERSSDRWGNVTSISDPRLVGWKTSYRYNANNQMVEQSQPNGDGQVGAVVTRVFYDQRGNQVGVRDANGNLNRQLYDADGNLIQEIHADGGVVHHNYNAFGELARTQDALGHITTFTYNLLGQQTQVTRLGAGNTAFAIYASGVGAAFGAPAGKLGYRLERTGEIVESAEYDAAGRKISETNGNNEVTRYDYDLRGNVVRVTVAGQVQQTSAYDNQGRKLSELDALGGASSWTYDYFGRVRTHTTLGGVAYSYGYDNAMQLVTQTGGGQTISRVYDGAGQLVRITDTQPAGGAYGQKVSSYLYDAAGHRIAEKTTQDGVTYQDNHIAYDALGRIRWVGDSRANVQMDYDAVGNRTRIYTHVINAPIPEQEHSDERFFKYDEMNRQVVVDAFDAAGTDLRDRGHRLTYDANGNRRSDTFQATKIVPEGGVQTITGYDESSGEATYGDPHTVYHNAGLGMVTEEYGYDGMGRLKSVVRDGIQTDLRAYDAVGRLLHTGPADALPKSYFELANGSANGQPLPGTGTETRINSYDAQGRLRYTRALKNDANGNLTDKYSLDYQEFDAAGNVKKYVLNDLASGAVNTYTYDLAKFEGYKEGAIHGTSNKLNPGTTTSSYDANGFLTKVDDSTKDANDRRFVNDASGQVLAVNQGGSVMRQLIVNGEVLARYGLAPDELQPKNNNGEPNLVDTNDFMFGYRPITPEFPTASPGSYTVRTGDSLRSIAQTAYGDSRLWFKIAEANGLEGDADLRVGHTLRLPNIVSGASNAWDTFQPYDPSKAVGDTSPNLPTPKPKSNWLKQLIMIIIVIIVSVFTAGALTVGLSGSLGSIMGAGASVLTGGGIAGGVAAAGAGATATGFAGTFGALGVAATAGAVGSIAGQVFGVASGLQESFDWKGVALGALSAAVGAGVGSMATGALAGPGFGATVARAALGNAITQGIGVATGLQKNFDWRGVAASAAGAGVGYGMSEALGITSGGIKTAAFSGADFGEKLFKSSLVGFVAGTAAAAARGGRVSVAQVATDAFGNALGYSLAEAASSGPTATRVDGLTFSETVARNEAARLGNTPLWALPDPSQVSFGDPMVLAGIDGGSMSDAGPGATTRAVEVAAKNMATMRAIAAQRLENMDPSSGNGLLWARTSQFIGWGQDNLGMANLMASDPGRFASMARADSMLGKSSLMGFYLDSSPENLLSMGEQALTDAIYNQGSARATNIGLNVERLARESLMPRLSGLNGAYENRYAFGDPTIENAVFFPQVAGNIGRLDGFTGILSAMVPGAGQFTAATQIDKRIGTANEMYSVGLLDRASLTATTDSLGRARAGLGTDFATSLVTMGNPLLKVAGGMLLGEDAFAGRMTSPGSLQRQWMNTAKVLMANSGASLGQLAVATTLGRYAAIGGAIDAIKVSGFAAETFTIAAARSRGLETFAVQRANGTGFDVLTARIDADGVVRDVMNLDVKNTIGSVDSVTAFGAGAKRAGTYQSNVNFARAQLIEQARLGNPYALGVEAALARGNFGLAVVTPAAAQVPQALVNSILQSTGKTVQKLPWLP